MSKHKGRRGDTGFDLYGMPSSNNNRPKQRKSKQKNENLRLGKETTGYKIGTFTPCGHCDGWGWVGGDESEEKTCPICKGYGGDYS